MAGQRSTVAMHPRRVEIEAQIRRNVPATHIAADFGLSRQAVSRAKAKLLAKPPGQGDDERAEMRRQIQGLYDSVVSLMKVAHDADNRSQFLAGVAEARKCLGLLSKIIGVLNETPAPAVAVNVQVDVVELRACILQALVKHPQARIDVAAALVELDDRKHAGET